MDSRTRFFDAMSENKRFAVRMALQQRRLEKEQKVMLSKVWHQKEILMDDYILINVRTPSPARPSTSSRSPRPFPGSLSSDRSFSKSPTRTNILHEQPRRKASSTNRRWSDARKGSVDLSHPDASDGRGSELSEITADLATHPAENVTANRANQTGWRKIVDQSDNQDQDAESSVCRMTLDPKLIMPMTSKRYRARKLATIVPVISVEGSRAMLYPNKEAKFGRAVTLHPKVRGRIERTTAIIASLGRTGITHNHQTTSRPTAPKTLLTPSVMTSSKLETSAPEDLPPVSSSSMPAAESGSMSRTVVGGRRWSNTDDEVALVPQVIKRRPLTSLGVSAAEADHRNGCYGDVGTSSENRLASLPLRCTSSRSSSFRCTRDARAVLGSSQKLRL